MNFLIRNRRKPSATLPMPSNSGIGIRPSYCLLHNLCLVKDACSRPTLSCRNCRNSGVVYRWHSATWPVESATAERTTIGHWTWLARWENRIKAKDLLWLGWLQTINEEYDEAEKSLVSAFELRSSDQNSWVNTWITLVRCLVLANRPEDAEKRSESHHKDYT